MDGKYLVSGEGKGGRQGTWSKDQSKSHRHQTNMTWYWFSSLAPEVVARARRLRVEREPPGCQKPTEPMRSYWTKWIWAVVILNCHSCDDHLHHGQLFVCLPFPIVVLLKSWEQEKTGWHSCKASRMMMMLLQRWRWRLMVTVSCFFFIFVFDHDEDEENLAVNMSTRAESRSGNARKTKTASPTVCNTLFFWGLDFECFLRSK